MLFRQLNIKTPKQAVDIAVRMYDEGSVVLSARESLLLLAESVLSRVRT